MHWLAEQVVATRDFLDLGGHVLLAILAATLVMWTLILERWWYLRFGYRAEVARVTARWAARRERGSWHARQIRRALVSEVAQKLQRTIPLIKTLVAVCPLLGLLGTVTGMVEVFDVMAIAGSANPRAMAQGVSRATIPTMAGMMAALSGFIVSVQLERRAKLEAARVADQLAPDEEIA
jgi:biopolymer transport protein ExbB